VSVVVIHATATGYDVALPRQTGGSTETTTSTAEAPNPILPVGKEIIWGAASFLVLFVVMRLWLFPKLKKGMDARHARIQGDLDRAERLRAEAADDVARFQAALAEVNAEAARRGGEAGAEAMQRAGTAASENFRRGTQAVAESQQQIVHDAAEKFEEVSRKLAQAVRGTTEDLRTLMVLPNAANGGLQDLHQSVTGLAEGVVRTNLRATQELFRLVNPSPFVELQQRFVSDYVNAVVEGSATLVRATRRTAEETLRPLEQQIEQRQQARRSGQSGAQAYQNAAE